MASIGEGGEGGGRTCDGEERIDLVFDLYFSWECFFSGNYGKLIFSNNIAGNGKSNYLGNSRRLYLFRENTDQVQI